MQLLVQTATAIRTPAAGKEITINVDASDDIEIEADEQLLGRLFANLLDNAVKYAPRGSRVTISMSCEPAHCIVTVHDNGTAIAASERERIFERFHRGENRDTEGAGLGLSIARSIAELHGGRLDLVPDVADGNTFRVRLPRS